MPVSPSFGFLQKMLGMQPPAQPTYGPMPAANPIAPSWMRTGFENAMDTTMGAMGYPAPNTNAAKVGQLMSAGFPMMSGLKSLFGMAPAMEQEIPEALNTAKSVVPKAMNAIAPKKPILDDAGRFLGFEPTEDPVFAAHVASSRNKKTLMKPNMDEVRSRYGNLAPSSDQVEAMINKYKK